MNFSGRVMLGVIFCGIAGDAFGCSICCTSLTDYFVPPIGLWSLLAIAWFLTNGAVRDLTKRKLPLQPGFAVSVFLVLGIGLLGAAMVGLGVMYLLFIPPAIGFARAISSRSETEVNGRKATKIVGWIYGSGVICAIVLFAYTHMTRKPEEFICKWGLNAPGFMLFNNLKGEEPASLEAYRYLVRNGDDQIVGKAAERIGEIGDPAVDIPLLKAHVRSGQDHYAARVRAAILKLEAKRAK